MKLIRMCVWFLVLNLGVCNQIWSEPVDYWWVIEIIVVIISYLMVDKNKKSVDKVQNTCYNNYRKTKRDEVNENGYI